MGKKIGEYWLLQMKQEKWWRGLEMHRNVQKCTFMYIAEHFPLRFEPTYQLVSWSTEMHIEKHF